MTKDQYKWNRVKEGESNTSDREKQYISRVYWSKPTLAYISKIKFFGRILGTNRIDEKASR